MKFDMIHAKRFALCLLALGAFVAKGDTIYVENAQMYGPFELPEVYQTDAKNMKAEALSIEKEFMDTNLPSVLSRQASGVAINRGEALSGAENGSLRVLSFHLNSSKFAKVNLITKGIGEVRVFVNGKEQRGRLTLEPGTTNVDLLCLSRETSKDTFDVYVSGKGLDGVAFDSSGKRPYGLKEMNEGKHVNSLRLSPSGKYLLTAYNDTKPDGTNVYSSVLTETTTCKVLQRYNEFKDFKWMKDSDEFYFTRKGVHGTQLVLYNPISQEEKILTECLPDGRYTLSPKRDYVIINRTQSGNSGDPVMKRLIDPDDRQPGWRGRNALFRYDLKTGVLRRLTFGKSSVWLNDISPDGQQLLLSFGKMEPSRLPFSSTTFVRMNAYTAAVDTLIPDTTFIVGAKFSPDASKLLIQASPNAFDNLGSELEAGQIANGYDYRLYVYDIASRTTEPLLLGFKPAVQSYDWNRADGMIYFSAEDGFDRKIFRLDPKTKQIVKYELPVSYVQSYSLSETKNPRMVFTGQTGTQARELYTCELTKNAASKMQQIGEIDFDELSKDWLMPSCHDWSFKSSRGDSIRGFFYLPPNFSPEKKYPLIVYYYGGCTPTSKILEFQYPLAVMAAQGYVVYVVEPSGAIGFGQEFAARHVGTWGKGSAEDIIEGTQAFVKEHPYVNEQKIGCCGASYGGFMTQYLQTRTDIFATAISHAGISNIASYWGGGYWGYTYGMVAQYGSYPWNNPQLYQEQSPLFNADKINTPLLLLHGTVDTNVPTNESQQMFTALRILGKPVSYVTIDGEDHVVTNFGKRTKWQKIIFAWFAHWLKDEPQWWEELFPNDDFGIEK